MSEVRARESVVVTCDDGITRTVRKDQPFDITDTVVQSHPWLFGLEKKRGRVVAPKVEQATAAPGELREL